MALSKLAFRTQIQVPELITKPTDDNLGTRTERGPLQPHEVDVEIDLPKIVESLGFMAVRNRSGVSRALRGLIVVKRVRRKSRGP